MESLFTRLPNRKSNPGPRRSAGLICQNLNLYTTKAVKIVVYKQIITKFRLFYFVNNQSILVETGDFVNIFGRFSLMLVTQWDGCLSCWDLLRRRSAPIVTAQLCDEPLLRLRPHEGV